MFRFRSIVALSFISAVVGCSTPKPDTPSKLPTLHNYPVLNAKDCPVKLWDYDEEKVKRRAKELGMRPVDYLHRANNKRWKPIKK